MGSARTTTDHDTIRRWAEERGGWPTSVKGASDDDSGILRIAFQDHTREDTLEPISWEEFFSQFEARSLVLLYQERTDDGQPSTFNKLLKRAGR